MKSDEENPDGRFRKFLTRPGGKPVVVSSYLESRNLMARISVALMVAIYIAMPKLANAGCGCDKPPPLPAAVIPGVAFMDMPVTFFDPGFVAGQQWSITFNSGKVSATVSAVVELKRDITDTTGTNQTPQLGGAVARLPTVPC